MLALVEGGEMVAVLPELAVRGQPHAITWRPLTSTVERHLIAATRIGRDQLPAVRELLDEPANVRPDLLVPDQLGPPLRGS
jgi:DNA-binding transcriptional LysR family regulator